MKKLNGISLVLAILFAALQGCSWTSNTAAVSDPITRNQIIKCTGGLDEHSQKSLLAAYDEAKKEGKVGTELRDVVETGLVKIMETIPEDKRIEFYTSYMECLKLEDR